MKKALLVMSLVLLAAAPAYAGPFARLFRGRNYQYYYYNYNAQTAWDFPQTVEVAVEVQKKPENCDEKCWEMLCKINEVRSEKGLAKLVW